jgi:thiosulfate dehydrogenase [quinone] large subunit
MTDPTTLLGNPSELTVPRVLQWLARSKVMAVAWTAMRIWLGIMWIQAGTSKLWGAENPAFLHHGGAGVAGFATHGTAAYTWWHSFLTGFVVPNAGWIAVLVAVAEFAIGVALVLGLFTRLAALGSLVLLFTYVMSGTASVCGFYALFALVLLATWRTSSWIGAGGLIAGYRQRRREQRGTDNGDSTENGNSAEDRTNEYDVDHDNQDTATARVPAPVAASSAATEPVVTHTPTPVAAPAPLPVPATAAAAAPLTNGSRSLEPNAAAVVEPAPAQ